MGFQVSPGLGNRLAGSLYWRIQYTPAGPRAHKTLCLWAYLSKRKVGELQEVRRMEEETFSLDDCRLRPDAGFPLSAVRARLQRRFAARDALRLRRRRQ